MNERTDERSVGWIVGRSGWKKVTEAERRGYK